MKKWIIFLFSVIVSNVYSQENEELFEVEYELNGQQLNAYAYTISNCSQTTIQNTWQNWVLNKGGNFNILKKLEATNVQFKNSENKYKNILSVVEDSTNQFTIINTMIDSNGNYLSESNPDFNEIYIKIKELAYQTKKACVRTNLKVANEAMMRLNKQNVALQTKKGNAIKSFLKDTNELLILENKKTLLLDNIDLIENLVERESDDKKIDILLKRKNKVEAELLSTETKINVLTNTIDNEKIKSKILDEEITLITEKLETQNTVIGQIKEEYNSIIK